MNPMRELTDRELDAVAGGIVANRTIQVTTAGAPQSGQFHQNNQSGTGPDHTNDNFVSNKGNRP
jgi:hypothetical protein